MTACTGCGADQPAGAKFCNECGAAMVSGCPVCGSAVPPAAKFCNECGADLRATAPAAREQPTAAASSATSPVASRRITSVLFGDLVGFTTLSESRDQEDVRELLSRYFEECSRIVARYGGVVEKFIGDAVMAVWGVPAAHEDDAERSVRAGLELVAAAGALGSDVDIPELAMRVGIVTGEVAVTVGAEMQGMVAGDPVNTASRVQSVAAPGQVWVDETTRLLTSASISYADVGSHELKGKAAPVPLWAARAVVGTAGGAQRADGLEAPLVGRDRDLRMVKELYHGVVETGRPALLVVSGDAGVGKTRLGWEFSKYTDGLAVACRWHAGKCVSYGEGVAYYAVAEAVRSRLETALGADETVETAELVERGLTAYVDDPDERAWLAPRLGALLGAGGAGGHAREDLFSAWTTFFERVSQGDEPVVMLIDDAQYADEGLVLFLEHLLAAATFPCFVMLLARPELVLERPGLATHRRATVLHLEALGDDEMAELVDGLVHGLPIRVREQLVRRSEGIPTYAVETVRALIDRDLVVPRGGAYVLAEADHLDLEEIGAPASLQALISARLDRLDPDQRRVVDRASVAGGSVEPWLLAELCADVPDLDAVLAALVRAQILTVSHDRLSSEQGRYQFVQSALRQVAYATLSRRDRKTIHLHLLEAMSRDDSDELAPVAAQHCIAALEAAPDDPDAVELSGRAVALLRRAAERARRLGAPSESVGHLARAVDLATDDRQRCEIRLAAALACNDAGKYDRARELAEAARDGFAAVDDPDGEALAAAAWSVAVARSSGDLHAAVAMVEPHLRILQTTPGKDEVLAQVLYAYLLAFNGLGGTDYALQLEQIKIADRLGDRSQFARATGNLGVQLMRDRLEELGILLFEKSTSVARECRDIAQLAFGLSNLASALAQRDAVAAARVADEALDGAQRAGIAVGLSNALVNVAIGRWATGDWDTVEGIVGESHALHDAAIVASVAAQVIAARGRDPGEVVEAAPEVDETAFYLDLARAVAQAFSGDRRAVATVSGALDGAYAVSGIYEDFTLFYGAALRIAMDFDDGQLLDRLRQIVDDDGSSPPSGLAGHRALLTALDAERVGDGDEVAEAAYLDAMQSYETWGSPVHLARARAAYGVWLTRRGRIEEAETLLREARTAYASLGAVAWLAELDAALSGQRVGS
ncbi:MAG TPA: adenylate/guanylate cyclase domain-containing protein [Nocardioides sp.]|uniref:adenylate/guanylate cyclase domain-containing protein n=1 Tax=Nocardioides sp. TaxID=35761 RepID=UPI002F427424